MVPIDEQIQKAISILNAGGIIIFPTDTAFGIGSRIDNLAAIDRIFEIRRRPKDQALPVLVRSSQQALAFYQHPSNIVRRLMKTHWPGALTIIDTCKKELLYSPICGGGDTVGMRHPKHETLQQILDGVGVPIVGPSANFHGKPTPYCFGDLDSELVALVDFVIEGTCTVGNVSTVVDCTSDPYRIVRLGAVVL